MIVSGFIFIFCNLGTRQAGSMSAYSIFNKGGYKILGDADSNQIDNELRNR
jgi:hypothetical protein